MNCSMETRRMTRTAVLLSLMALLWAAPGMVLASMDAQAGGLIVVTTFQDEFNTDGDCALREAVVAANMDAAVDQCPAGSGTDTIILSAGTYILSRSGAGEDQSQTGDLDLLADVVIRGDPAGGTIIDGAGSDRIFHASGAIAVTLRYLAIQNGFVPGSDTTSRGGGVFIEDANVTIDTCVISENQAGYTGGGVDNQVGEVTITNTTLHGNQARIGGGIFNGGALTLANSTLSGNTAEEIGGGLDNNEQAVLTNVTIYGNSAALDPSDPQGLRGLGGGIFSDWNLSLNYVTLSHNSGDGLANRGSAALTGTLLSANTGANCSGSGSLISDGYNLDDGFSCGFIQTGDLSGIDPQLDALADNGGATQTMALLPGSPALDSGGESNCPATDQRGVIRPQASSTGGALICDIGAYEEGIYFTRLLLPAILKP